MTRDRLAVALVGLGVLGSGCVVVPGPPVPVVVAPPPPPSPVVEAVPLAPGPAVVWVPGYWAWSNPRGGYVWVPGRHVHPPGPAYVWTPGRWAPTVGGHLWIGGHWRIR